MKWIAITEPWIHGFETVINDITVKVIRFYESDWRVFLKRDNKHVATLWKHGDTFNRGDADGPYVSFKSFQKAKSYIGKSL